MKAFFLKNKELILLLVWGVTAVFFSINHVVWRDEMRALSIAKDSSSIFDLVFLKLKNEGHPGLWYIVLYFFYSLFKANWVLKLCSLLFGFINSYLILYRIRLPFIVKTLLLFSYLFFFEYTIISRNYGIALTFILILFLMYEKSATLKYSILFFTIAFLLSQTNLIGFFISFFFIAIHLLEQKNNLYKKIGLAVFTMLLYSTLFYFSTKTDLNSVFYLDKTIIFNKFYNYNFFQLIIPYYFFSEIIGGANSITIPISILLIIATLWTLRSSLKLTIFFYILMILIHLVSLFVYILCYRHIGLVIVLYLLFANKIIKSKHVWLSYIMFFSFFIAGVLQMIKELQIPLSSSKEIGHYINNTNKNNIIIGERDFYVESIAYYTDNPIYIAREKKFKKYIYYTKQNKDTLMMSELFHLSDSLNQDIFLVFESYYDNEKKGVFKYYNYKNNLFIFDTINSSRVKFLQKFNASSKENYDLLLITKKPKIDLL